LNPTFAILFALLLATASLFIVWPLKRHLVDEGAASPIPTRPWSAVWIVTGLVFASVGLYTLVGEPDALNLAPASSSVPTVAPPQLDLSQGVGQAQIETMVARLAQRLKSQPQDVKGWRMLAKSYETLGRFDDAVKAYKEVLTLEAPDPDLLTDYAVTLGMSKGRTLAGEPEVLIDQALKIDPNHVQALALSGSAAFEARDYKRAVAQWQKLLSLVPADAEVRAGIERNVEKAQALIR
jgi:cytochrome c-type biogenesis protein CcmH/NrfG